MTPPSAVQLPSGKVGFVAASTPNSAPTLFVKENWKAPSVSLLALVNEVSVGVGTLRLTMLLVLGMPLTNTVASAQPGGKFQTGREVNEFVDQLVESRNVLCPHSMLRYCTRG